MALMSASRNEDERVMPNGSAIHDTQGRSLYSGDSLQTSEGSIGSICRLWLEWYIALSSLNYKETQYVEKLPQKPTNPMCTSTCCLTKHQHACWRLMMNHRSVKNSPRASFCQTSPRSVCLTADGYFMAHCDVKIMHCKRGGTRWSWCTSRRKPDSTSKILLVICSWQRCRAWVAVLSSACPRQQPFLPGKKHPRRIPELSVHRDSGESRVERRLEWTRWQPVSTSATSAWDEPAHNITKSVLCVLPTL